MMEMVPVLAKVGRMIIFVSSRSECEAITQQMKNSPEIGGKGLIVDSIHGDKHQSDRNAALAALRKGVLSALVAADVAARGLDITDVRTVVNFDAAKNLDSHVHRIGRCGRLSAQMSELEHGKGVACTLLTQKNADFASVLIESFEREGREVSDELIELAMKSKHFGGGGRCLSRKKAGLGYEGDIPSESDCVSKVSHYGTSSSQSEKLQHPSKRSRWH